MQFEFTEENQLIIHLEECVEHEVFPQLIADALSGEDSTKNVVQQISTFMQSDEDWQEFILPEVSDKLEEDISIVLELIKTLNEDTQQIVISDENRHAWYSTLNQARLNLNFQHNLSDVKEELDTLSQDSEMISFLMRDYLYTQLQSLILEQFGW